MPPKKQAASKGSAKGSPAKRAAAAADDGGSPSKRARRTRTVHHLLPPVTQDKLGSNAKIIACFEEFADLYGAAGDAMRHKAFKGAAAAVRSQYNPVTSGKEARKLDGIGKATAEKIDEFLATGKMKKLDEVRKEFKSHLELGRVHGIGPKHAQELIGKGIKSVKDLREAVSKGKVELTHAQKIGLAHVNDFAKRIPRAEVKAVGERVEKVAKSLDPFTIVTVCGSYRRGSDSSGDIDIHVTHAEFTKGKAGKKHDPLRPLVVALEKDGLVTDTLALGDTKFQGVCRLSKSKPFRRIDMQALPLDQYWTGVCYYTGSGNFNRALRMHAHELGYKLSEHGLVAPNGKNVAIKSEKDIFDELGLDYVDPGHREYGKQ